MLKTRVATQLKKPFGQLKKEKFASLKKCVAG